MQALIVPASTSGEPVQQLTTYLINGTVAVDAGCLGLYGSIEQQSRVRHVFLSHCHLDHLATLPPFLDAVYDGSGDCVTVHGNAHVLECLRKDVFNNRLYPDFLHISTFRPPYLKLNELKPGQAVEVEGLRVTPVEVSHVVPTYGYVIEDGATQVVFPSDTSPTQEIWRAVNRNPKPATVFLECTFPESMAWLAEIAKHLTPSLFAAEAAKVKAGTRFIAVHTHPRHRAAVAAELRGLVPGVEFGEGGTAYEV